MATIVTRDFLRILDTTHCPAQPHSPSSLSASLPLHFGLRSTENECCKYNAESFCEEEDAATTACHVPRINDSAADSYRRRKRSAEQAFLNAANVSASLVLQPTSIFTEPSFSLAVKWEALKHPQLVLSDSMTSLKIPLARKASLTRFFQKRKERRLNRSGASPAKSKRTRQDTPAHYTQLDAMAPATRHD